MGKSKSLGFQIHTALNEINLQDKEKRIETYNREHNTDFSSVGKREFKKGGESIKYIFSKRSSENITEKSKNFVKFLKENYNLKMVRDIKPEMCIAYLDTKQGCSNKTISAYKNMLEKVSLACAQKFNINGFYTDTVRQHKVQDTYKTNSARVYTNEQIEKIYNFESKRQAEIKCMCFLGCRISEMNIKAEDVNLTKHNFITTAKDGRIDTFLTVHIRGKGGKDSYRPILPQYKDFFAELIKDKQPQEKLFNLPTDTKQVRQVMSNELRRITKILGFEQTGKNHEFRKYHSQLALDYYINVKGWSKEKAETFVIQRHLSHGPERQDLKKVYLYS